MKSISIQDVSEQLHQEGWKHQLRDDGKIVFSLTTKSFRDPDGDAFVFCVAELPYPNILLVATCPLFSVEGNQAILALVKFLTSFNSWSPYGCFYFSQESGYIHWRSYLYMDGAVDIGSTHVISSVVSLAESLDEFVVSDDGCVDHPVDNTGARGSEDLLVERLEQCLRLDPSEEQAAIQPLLRNSNELKKDSTESSIQIELSPRLSDGSRELAIASLEQISSYLKKIRLELPGELGLRIQHGSNLENVSSGPNKGPYLVVVDSAGKEKRSAKVFMSKRGNLNHYVAVSTIVSRA